MEPTLVNCENQALLSCCAHLSNGSACMLLYEVCIPSAIDGCNLPLSAPPFKARLGAATALLTESMLKYGSSSGVMLIKFVSGVLLSGCL